MGRILVAHVPRRETGVPILNEQTVVQSDDGNIYVVSSSTGTRSGGMFVDETMIFHGNAKGDISDWHEVDCIKPHDHIEGIRIALAGYETRRVRRAQ